MKESQHDIRFLILFQKCHTFRRKRKEETVTASAGASTCRVFGKQYWASEDVCLWGAKVYPEVFKGAYCQGIQHTAQMMLEKETYEATKAEWAEIRRNSHDSVQLNVVDYHLFKRNQLVPFAQSGVNIYH